MDCLLTVRTFHFISCCNFHHWWSKAELPHRVHQQRQSLHYFRHTQGAHTHTHTRQQCHQKHGQIKDEPHRPTSRNTRFKNKTHQEGGEIRKKRGKIKKTRAGSDRETAFGSVRERGRGRRGAEWKKVGGKSLARAGYEHGARGSGDRARWERREGGRGQPISE